MQFPFFRARLRRLAVPALVAGAALPASPAAAQDWLQHPSGDIRSYHLDWLAVCEEGGAGECRAVYSAPDIGSDAAFDRRLALRYDEAAGVWTPEVMDRGMPAGSLAELAFAFDEDEPIVVPSGAFAPILPDTGTAGSAGETAADADFSVEDGGAAPEAEAVVLTDPAYADILLAEMRAGRRLLVTYQPPGGGDGEADLSLFGLTAAMAAIEAHVAGRDDDA